MTDYSRYSFWLDSLDEPLTPRPPLEGHKQADVVIVGAGYTGLWTAYYLQKHHPWLNIVMVDAEIAGFGASGRNGGWCSALFAASYKKIAGAYGHDAAIAMQRAMFDTVDEVGRVCKEEGIDCDFHKGGTLTLVTAATQLERVREEVDEKLELGFTEEDFRFLDEAETRARINVDNCLGAAYTPHCARLHPAKLARGLATKLERHGVVIHEGSRATSIEPRCVTTEHGQVTAPIVVRATEGYTVHLPKLKRRFVPLYSLMVATEPLPKEVWDEIGWDNAETLNDGRHLLIYAQRTADGRVAIGGRGAPYHFGSQIDDEFDHHSGMHSAIEQSLKQLFPVMQDVGITHRWGGPLGVPRDWFSSVNFDPESGMGEAGGYVGDGVSTTNLAGRVLADLILKRESDITALPWVGHKSRSWEPEPFRWLGINSALKLMASADKKEARRDRPTKRGEILKRLIGI